MNEKLRWTAVGIAVVVGAGLALYGTITGEMWISLVGTLFSAGGGMAAPSPKKAP